MTELVAIEAKQFGAETIQTVNARDLHAFLEIGKDFSTWMKDRIAQYDFIEGIDYIKSENLIAPISGRSKARVRVAFEYFLSLPMAKELSMVERNAKGKEARLYFIECEKIAKQNQPKALPNLSKMEILQMAMESEQQRIALKAELELAKPAIEFTEQVKIAPDAISIAKAAKLIGTGRNRLLEFMRQIGWVTRHNEPYQSKIEAGYLNVKISEWEHPEKGLQRSVTTLVTGKGLVKLQQLWKERFV